MSLQLIKPRFARNLLRNPSGEFLSGIQHSYIIDGTTPVFLLTPFHLHKKGASGESVLQSGVAPLANLPLADMTVECWIRPKSDAPNLAHSLFNKRTGGAGWLFRKLTSNNLQFFCNHTLVNVNVNCTLPGTSWYDGSWHHVAATFDIVTKTARVWWDGIALTPNITNDAGSGIYSTDVAIAFDLAGPSGAPFIGDIGWVRISSVQRYNDAFIPPPRGQFPGIDAGTVAQWNMQEGAGTSIDNAQGNAAGDLTIAGGITWGVDYPLDWYHHGPGSLRTTRERSRFGWNSVIVSTRGRQLAEGVYVQCVPNVTRGPFTGSAYLRGSGIVRLRMADQTNGIELAGEPIRLADDVWRRVSLMFGAGGAPIRNLRMYIETYDPDLEPQAVEFWVDGAQIEEGPLTSYVDGEQPGCYWNGLTHLSTSERGADTIEGGELLSFQDVDADLYPVVASGLGAAPIEHLSRSAAFWPGAIFERSRILPRAVELNLWAKNQPEGEVCKPGTLAALNRIRKALWDVINPDRSEGDRPFVLRYLGERVGMETTLLYDAGLGFEGDLRNPFFNSFNVRGIGYDPYWREDNQEAAELGFVQSLKGRVVARERGAFRVMGSEVNPPTNVTEIVLDAVSGRLYLCGTNVGLGYLTRYYQPESNLWLVMGDTTKLDGGPVQALAVAPDGSVYAGGAFTREFGGPANTLNKIARWSPTTRKWEAVGAGFNDDVLDILIAPNGDVYASGWFDDLYGGVGNTLLHIARWDGDNWSAVGSPQGADGRIEAMAMTPDGATLYFVGLFLSAGGVADCNYVGQYDVASNTISALATGLNARAVGVAVSPSGMVYVTGAFTQASGIAANRIAMWNGAAWYALGEGLNEEGHRVFAPSDHRVVVSGSFTGVGSLESVPYFAIWNGSEWERPPLSIPSPIIYGFIYIDDMNYILTGNWSPTHPGAFSGVVTTVTNPGTAKTWPKVLFVGPGRIEWIENITTGRRIMLDLVLETDEQAEIDLAPGQRRMLSPSRGDVTGSILPGSDLAEFWIAPGENEIYCYIEDAGDKTAAVVTFVPAHSVFDGAAP